MIGNLNNIRKVHGVVMFDGENEWWDDPYKISKIEIIISDTSDMEIIKIYDLNEDNLEFGVDQGRGVKWVYNHILNKYTQLWP